MPLARKAAFTYALGLEHDLAHQAAVYAHYGTGYAHYGTGIAYTPIQEDETSDNVDAGIEKHFSQSLIGRVGWFRSAMSNYPITYLSGDYYVQVPAGFTQSGLEAELKGTIPAVRVPKYDPAVHKMA